MVRLTRRALCIAALCGGFMLWNAGLRGQTSTPPAASSKGAVIGTGTFTAFVENMDRSLAFFHDVFRMEVPPLPESGAVRITGPIRSSLRCSTSRAHVNGTSPRASRARE